MARRRRSNGQGALFKRTDGGPWIASWFDHTGKRKERSTRTTDKATAQRILTKHVADAALRREGVIDPRKDRYVVEGRKPLADHITDYVAHCRHVGQASRHVDQKQTHLMRLLEVTGLSRLSDLNADALEHYMRTLGDDGRSARTMNFARQIVVAFASWCAKTDRLESNPLKVVPKLDDQRDRRRVRRPLSDDELARLLSVAEDHGRKAWYLTAVLAGLRKGDLQRLRWCDLDFDNGTITIHEGKAKRVDVIPMHPQLAEELAARRDQSLTVPTAKVFPQTVTDRTRQKDLQRAGIPLQDEAGRVVDLHGLRTTLGTNLARAGVTPQIAQRIMRHSDYKTTMAHYTVLGLHDTAKAIGALPPINLLPSDAVKATGTIDVIPTVDQQQYPQQREHEAVQVGARTCHRNDDTMMIGANRNPPINATFCESPQHDATMCEQPAGVTQLVECQPSKLNVEGSSPFARFSPFFDGD